MRTSVIAILLSSVLGLTSIGSDVQAQLVSDDQSNSDETSLIALFRRQYVEGEFLEAAETAKRLIRKLIASDGTSIARANALQLLASAQLAGGDATAAAQNYADAVAMIVDQGDRLSPRLVDPLQGLARSQREGGEVERASRTYRRAIHVQRVNFGLHDLEQAELIGELIDLLVENGEFDAADGLQTYQLEVLRNNLAETDSRVINAWDQRGQLLSRRGRHVDAQENYVFAADIMREVDGANSLAQVPLLRSLADSYLHHANADLFTRIEMARGELEKIIMIVERNPLASFADKGHAHIDMGNFMLRFGDWNAALRHYRRSWEYLDTDVEGNSLRSRYFGAPEAINLHVDDAPDATDFAEVKLFMDIDNRGEARDVVLADGEVDADVARRAIMAGKKLRFRPAFHEGEPIETERFRQVVSVPVFGAPED